MKEYGICIKCSDFMQRGDACSCYIIKIDTIDQSIEFTAPEIRQAMQAFRSLYRKTPKKARCKDPFPTFAIFYSDMDLGEAKYLTSARNPVRGLARTLTKFEKKIKGKRYSGR
tara:strand:- start:485 stop:823 length:339 start_codon:yes stop_codon:yes gene_type:complete